MAEPTALWIAQEFCRRTSLPVPATLTGASDDTTQQIWGLMNEGAADLGDRYNFQELQQSVSFTHANGLQYLAYDLTSLADFKFFVNNTLWANTLQQPVVGPLSIARWQAMTTMAVAPARYSFTLYGNAVRIYSVPSPVGSETFSFYYQSRYVVLDSTAPNGVSSDTYLTDNATPRLSWSLIIADLRWRYKKEKGLPYAEDQRISEMQLVNHVGRQPSADLTLDTCARGPAPGILIPAGNWAVP